MPSSISLHQCAAEATSTSAPFGAVATAEPTAAADTGTEPTTAAVSGTELTAAAMNGGPHHAASTSQPNGATQHEMRVVLYGGFSGGAIDGQILAVDPGRVLCILLPVMTS